MLVVEDVRGVLGIPAKDPLDIVDSVCRGLSPRSLERIADLIAPHDSAFRYRIVPRATWARIRKSKRLSPQQSAMVTRLASIWAQALMIWKDERDARDFLQRPHQLLHGRAPIDVALANEQGAELVKQILGRIEAGVSV